jgi:cell wall-associated NlpC family hydrolase
MRGGVARSSAAVLGALATLSISVPAHAATDAGPFPDVPAGHWAAGAITFITDETREWIPARGEGFGPDDPLTRRDLARAMVRAFPPEDGWTSAASYDDVAADDPMLDAFRWAARRDWLPVKDGLIKPDAVVSRRILDPALVRALGYAPHAASIARLATEDGKRLIYSWSSGFLMVANRLELYPNLSVEAAEIRPADPLTRAHAAIAFARTANLIDTNPWSIAWRLDGYLDSPTLPAMTPARLKAVRWALRYASFPYIWGGEWHARTPSDYPFGAQPQGGFDCSGFAWWVLAAPSDSRWDVPRLRGYEGWSLAGRTATDMARGATVKRTYAKTRPMDIAFFELNNDPTRFEHAGLLLGNGWMIHSSGSRGGVTLEQIGDGYWRERFRYARRVIPNDA